MGLLRSLLMLLLLLPFIPILLSPQTLAQSPKSSSSSARLLDSILQDYAYQAFNKPRTGIPYDGNLPSNLTGIKITAMRLRSGSLRTRGVQSYKEFHIPIGIIEKPYVERLVLVYQNLGNFSSVYYPLPGYTYLSPVLGLLAYNASNLSATNLPELDIQASGNPISIKFQNLKSVPIGSTPKCVYFDLQGTSLLSNVTGNECQTINQGHFGIVIESIAPSPAPEIPPPSEPTPPSAGGGGPGNEGGKTKNNKKVWKIVGIVIGGLVLLVVLGLLIFCLKGYKERKKIEEMENAAEVGEALQMTSIRDTRAPIAMGTRTQPGLEHDYVP